MKIWEVEDITSLLASRSFDLWNNIPTDFIYWICYHYQGYQCFWRKPFAFIYVIYARVSCETHHKWMRKEVLLLTNKQVDQKRSIQGLTLNVPGDCGSSRPTRVEPQLHCVGIEWQLRGRCVGSAAHSTLHAIAARALSAARAIEPRPTHFARVRALGVITQPAHFARARALCVGPRGSAHYAWARAFCVSSWPLQPARLAAHALISFSMQFSTHSICYPSKSRPILSKANTIFLTQGRNHSLHNLLIMPQLRQNSNRTDGFLTSWHFKTLRNIEIFTKLLQTWNIYQESRVVVSACLYLKRDICSVWYDSVSCNTIVYWMRHLMLGNLLPNAGNFLPYPHNRRPMIPP